MKNTLFRAVSLFMLLSMVAGCAPGSIAANTTIPATQANTAVPATQINTSVPATQPATLAPTKPANTAAPTIVVPTPVPTTVYSTPDPSSLQTLPNTGQQISPLAIKDSKFEILNPDLTDNPDWLAGQAVTTVISPDKKTMLVLTSGFNRVYRTDGKPDAYGTYFNWPDSKEYVFVYDISTKTPIKKQVVTVPNSYNGIVFDPSGTAFYVSGGMGDFPFDSTGNVNPAKSGGDNVHIFTLSTTDGTWQHDSELTLGHTAGVGLDVEAPPVLNNCR